MTLGIDPIAAVVELANTARGTSFWPVAQAVRIGELAGQGTESGLAQADGNWPEIYAEALTCAKDSLADLQRQQRDLSRQLASEVSRGVAEVKRIEALSAEAERATEKLAAGIQRAADFYQTPGGCLDRQVKRILDAVTTADGAFAVSEKRSKGAVELRLADAFASGVEAGIQESLARWRSKTIADLPVWVVGEAPHLLERLHDHARWVDFQPFSFGPVSGDGPTEDFSLRAMSHRMEVPGVLVLFTRAFGREIATWAVLVAVVLAVMGLFVQLGDNIDIRKDRTLAAVCPLIGAAVYLWARHQQQQAVAKMVADEQARMREAYRLVVHDALASQRELLGNTVRRYFSEQARAFAEWSNELLRRTHARTNLERTQVVEQNRLREEETRHLLGRVRAAGQRLKERLIPEIEVRARDLARRTAESEAEKG